MTYRIDDSALLASVDLIGRTGAAEFSIGYLHDDVPIAEAGWYAQAQYRGSRIICEDQPGPVEAVHALAVRILTGAKCAHCGRLTSLDPSGAWARDSVLVDGTPWLREQQADAGICLWQIEDGRYERGCRSSGGVKKPRRPWRARRAK